MKRRKTKRACGLLAALVLALADLGATPAPDYTLEGVVVDRELRIPVPNATVTLLAARRAATTDPDGVFSFGTFEISASDQLVISHPDYRTVRLPVGSLPASAWSLRITMIREPAGIGEEQPEPRPR